ncbi:MAG: hypothetical protein KC933_19020 [Myxococcales bacterium]|nr:hypothetical protein [Myxococcales bacterium]
MSLEEEVRSALDRESVFDGTSGAGSRGGVSAFLEERWRGTMNSRVLPTDISGCRLATADEILDASRHARERWWACQRQAELEQVICRRSKHIVYPFLRNHPGEGGVEVYRCFVWIMAAAENRRVLLTMDLDGSFVRRLEETTRAQLDRIVFALLESLEPEVL